MNIRKTVIQTLYDKVNNDELAKELNEILIDTIDFAEKYLPEEAQDDMKDKLCMLEHTAFFVGAQIILDFIAGRENMNFGE